jgi:hypothetical protein
LSSSLRYRSLYESQVRREADSPAHYLEYLQITLELLEKHRARVPRSIGRIHLVPLLTAGIPVDLPDNMQLRVGVLRPDSNCVGQPLRTVQTGCLAGVQGSLEVIAVLRNGKAYLRDTDLKLEKGDHLLIVCSPQAFEKISPHLDPPELS